MRFRGQSPLNPLESGLDLASHGTFFELTDRTELQLREIIENLAAFHAAFGVQPGDKLFLDPKKRARIW